MGHSINAIVGPTACVAKIVEVAGGPLPTPLPFGLSIAPLGHVQIDCLTRCEPSQVADGFKYLSPALERGLYEAGGSGFVYIETEYFGGIGFQGAAIFSGAPIPVRLAGSEDDAIGPDSPINSALRALGVTPARGRDEFDTLGLDSFRDLEDLGLIEWDDD